MIDQLIKFLAEQKQSLLLKEIGVKSQRTKDAIEAQIRVIETILLFIATNKAKTKLEDRDMELLKLSLDAQARPLNEIRSKRGRKGTGEVLVKSILAFIEALEPNTGKELNAPGLKPKTIAAKIGLLKKTNMIPKNIIVTRSGGKIFVGKE